MTVSYITMYTILTLCDDNNIIVIISLVKSQFLERAQLPWTA